MAEFRSLSNPQEFGMRALLEPHLKQVIHVDGPQAVRFLEVSDAVDARRATQLPDVGPRKVFRQLRESVVVNVVGDRLDLEYLAQDGLSLRHVWKSHVEGGGHPPQYGPVDVLRAVRRAHHDNRAV